MLKMVKEKKLSGNEAIAAYFIKSLLGKGFTIGKGWVGFGGGICLTILGTTILAGEVKGLAKVEAEGLIRFSVNVSSSLDILSPSVRKS